MGKRSWKAKQSSEARGREGKKAEQQGSKAGQEPKGSGGAERGRVQDSAARKGSVVSRRQVRNGVKTGMEARQEWRQGSEAESKGSWALSGREGM